MELIALGISLVGPLVDGEVVTIFLVGAKVVNSNGNEVG